MERYTYKSVDKRKRVEKYEIKIPKQMIKLYHEMFGNTDNTGHFKSMLKQIANRKKLIDIKLFFA